jgi:spore coat protein A
VAGEATLGPKATRGFPHFQVIDVQNFDVVRYLDTGTLTLLGKPHPPDPTEIGWEDTVRVNPGEVVRIIARFDHLGNYPVHCHILEVVP